MDLESEVSAFVQHDADGAIDQDLFCLVCGYNLRGLSGDPVRCPECGSPNDLGKAAIPVQMIQRALRDMETSPSACAGFAFAAIVFSTPFLLTANFAYPCTMMVMVPSVIAWIPFYFRMKRVYDNQRGWRGILLRFHMATFLCASGVPLIWTLAFLANNTASRVDAPMIAAVGGLAIIFLVFGLRLYRSARNEIAAMQREAAVRVAREALRLWTTRGLMSEERRRQ